MRHNIHWLLLVFLVGTLYYVLSCSLEGNNPIAPDNGPVIDTIGPHVVLTIPNKNKIDVIRSVTIEAVFSEPLDPTSINDSTFFIDDSIYGVVTYSDNRATLTLNNAPGINRIVHPRILASVRDTAGNQMKQDYEWLFRTSPTVNLLDLIGDYTGVYTAVNTLLDTNAFPHRQQILWSFTNSTFSMQIDTSAAFDSTFQTCRLNGSFSFDNLKINLQITQSVPDSAAGFTMCVPEWNPGGLFTLFRITPFADTIEFQQLDSTFITYENIKIFKIPSGTKNF